MAALNYHHLRYFRAVAREGNLTAAARGLNVSQSSLSAQIRILEDRLGHPLFDRVGRGLRLTEAGRIALDHADRIFETGDDLLAVLAAGGDGSAPLRVGAPATLSRNFQMRFLAPILDVNAALTLRAAGEAELIASLRALALDVVLTTARPEGDDLIARRIDAQPVALHAVPERLRHDGLKALLETEPVILPTDPALRSGFATLADRLGARPRVAAEVDDMAMIRLLAREGVGVALAPAVVLADELASGRLATAPHDLDLWESFHAVTTPRGFPHPLLKALLPGGDGLPFRDKTA